MTIREREQYIKNDLETCTTWEEKYEYIIDLGRYLEVDPSVRSEANRVRGCQSAAWVDVEKYDDGTVGIHADSDALIVRGLLAILVQILNKRTPEDIRSYDPQFFSDLGLMQNVSPARMNGLLALINKMKSLV
jgi:cysteine desulfuration protein SufE